MRRICVFCGLEHDGDAWLCQDCQAALATMTETEYTARIIAAIMMRPNEMLAYARETVATIQEVARSFQQTIRILQGRETAADSLEADE